MAHRSIERNPRGSGGKPRRGPKLSAFQFWSLVPMITVLVLFSVWPMIQLVLMSLAEVSFVQGQRTWEWVGFANFMDIPGDEGYWIALRNTFVFAVATVSIELVLGFVLAYTTTKARRGAAVYRTILMLPFLVPTIANATMWRLMYNGNFGLINEVGLSLGFSPQYWLSNPQAAMPAVIAVSVWYWTPYVFILLLAGLQSIPQGLYEAARIDGASGWHTLRYITLPLLTPTILVTLMFRTILAFKVFDIVYGLTSGGPGLATEVINTYVYEVLIAQQRLNYGSALAVVGVIVVGLVALIYNRFFGIRRGAY